MKLTKDEYSIQVQCDRVQQRGAGGKPLQAFKWVYGWRLDANHYHDKVSTEFAGLLQSGIHVPGRRPQSRSSLDRCFWRGEGMTPTLDSQLEILRRIADAGMEMAHSESLWLDFVDIFQHNVGRNPEHASGKRLPMGGCV